MRTMNQYHRQRIPDRLLKEDLTGLHIVYHRKMSTRCILQRDWEEG